MAPKPPIKMVAFNPLRRRYETVFPEDEVALDAMTPLFYNPGLDRYLSVPGVGAAQVYDAWLAAMRKA